MPGMSFGKAQQDLPMSFPKPLCPWCGSETSSLSEKASRSQRRHLPGNTLSVLCPGDVGTLAVAGIIVPAGKASPTWGHLRFVSEERSESWNDSRAPCPMQSPPPLTLVTVLLWSWWRRLGHRDVDMLPSIQLGVRLDEQLHPMTRGILG